MCLAATLTVCQRVRNSKKVYVEVWIHYQYVKVHCQESPDINAILTIHCKHKSWPLA